MLHVNTYLLLLGGVLIHDSIKINSYHSYSIAENSWMASIVLGDLVL